MDSLRLDVLTTLERTVLFGLLEKKAANAPSANTPTWNRKTTWELLQLTTKELLRMEVRCANNLSQAKKSESGNLNRLIKLRFEHMIAPCPDRKLELALDIYAVESVIIAHSPIICTMAQEYVDLCKILYPSHI